jgi:Ca-activated chloride channel homolog
VSGYALAERTRTPGSINRLVLVSDGGANVGVTDKDLIGSKAGSADEDGIYLTGVGVGTGASYRDALMDTVTDVGKGAAVFVDSAEEATKVFEERFVNTFDVAARNVQLRLDLPPGFEIVSTTLEAVSSDPADIDPQHLAPNDAMVFFQHLRTCAPEVIDAHTELSVTVAWQHPVTFEERDLTQAWSFHGLLEEPELHLRKGAAIAAYVDALQASKDHLAAEESRLAAYAALDAADALHPADEDLAEIRSVLDSL